ncbi:hypothetical protein HDU67_003091, partial [Dinochytrium kinnereticum]
PNHQIAAPSLNPGLDLGNQDPLFVPPGESAITASQYALCASLVLEPTSRQIG